MSQASDTNGDTNGDRSSEGAGDALVVFGLTGDLGHDELLPAIVLLHATGRLGVPVIGVGRTEPDDVDALLRDAIDDSLARRANATIDELIDAIDLRFVAGDATEAATWDDIADELGDVACPVVYAALPPALLGEVAKSLSVSRLPERTRLVLEKPFGNDRSSAAELYDEITGHLDAERLFLVDHFLAKAPIRALPIIRSSAALAPLLGAERVEAVTVDFPEAGGLEGRGSFYESVGVVADVVQNHLLQTVAQALVEPGGSRVDLLRAIAPIDPTATVLGQYDGYLDLDDVDDDSTVPTLLDTVLTIDTDRWRGVPVRLRTGKRVASAPFAITWRLAGDPPTAVTAEMKPSPSISIELNSLDPDTHGVVTAPARLDLPGDHGALDAYAVVLHDALCGERHHMASIDEIVECWRIVEPILGDPDELLVYPPGFELTASGYMPTMSTDHGPSIKDDDQYEALRDEGMSKSKAAAIANADGASERGGQSPPYEEWTKDELYERAQELDVEGRSDMTKDELIDALRNG